MQANNSTDWFGMQHDGPAKTVSFKLAANVPAYLEAQIDPAAHGDAGLGPIERGVSIKLVTGQELAFDLKATVVK